MSIKDGAALFAQTHPGPHSDDEDQQPPGLEKGRLMFAASRGDKDAAAALKDKHHTTTDQRADYDA